MKSEQMNARQRWLLLAGCIVFGLLLPATCLLPETEPAAEIRGGYARADARSIEDATSGTDAHNTAATTTPDPMVQTPNYGAMLVKTVLALGFVCLLAFIALKWGLGRLYGANQADDAMAVMSRMRLGPKREVLVARIGPRHLILGSTEQQLSVLGELSADEATDYFQQDTAGEANDG